jgi:lipoate---protein ligase
MERWRLLTDDGVAAADGLAVDEALMAAYGRGEPDRRPTLRLYTYASHCALVGRYQHLEAEVDVDACRQRGVSYNRRPTGGGAIVMGHDQLGVALVDRVPASERPKQTLQRLSRGIVRGLEEVGVRASFRGKNDLEVGGRKIAGLGLYLDDHGALLFHASILAGLDVPFMLSVLNVPAAKLGDKGVAAVGERVTTVTGETGTAWSGPSLRDAIATGFEKEFGISLAADGLDDQERAAAAGLVASKYADDAWIFQRSPRASTRGTAVLKLPAGLVRVHVALERQTIQSVLFTGDFNTLPPGLVQLEAALKWSAFEPERVRATVRQVVGLEDADGLEAELLAAAVVEAAERAGARSVAAPERQGSCYFPEVS